MSCAACSARVFKAVSNLKGVKEANVNLLTNSMVISYDENILNDSDIINAVIKSGYGAEKYIPKNNSIASKKDELEELVVKAFQKAQNKAQEVAAEKTKEVL